MMVMYFEMPRANVDTTANFVGIKREELLENEQPVFEIRIGNFQSQFYEHVIVLIIDNTETVAFEHFSISHSTVAQENLRALGEGVLTSLHVEVVIIWHIINDLIPYGLRHIFAHLDLIFVSANAADLAHLGVLPLGSWTHALVPKSFLFNQKVQVIVTFKA